ncbi:MAG: Alr-MurF fusion protein [Gaiellaceae bacterium]|nr:Alr-MurF fusion protein [Gaiellaceae bacterium]
MTTIDAPVPAPPQRGGPAWLRSLRLLTRLEARLPATRFVPRSVRWSIRRALVSRPIRRHVASCSDVTFVGVTGSLGKTTTTQLIASILAVEGPTTTTLANQNGVHGVPMTLRRVRPDDRFGVLEVAIDHQPGEMAWFGTLFRPRVAVLTSLGDDHVVWYGSREAVAREKRRLLEAVPADGVVVANADDASVRETVLGLGCRVVLAGAAADADVRLTDVRLDWPHGMEIRLNVHGRELAGRTKLVARHQASLVAMAVAVADACGVEPRAALDRAAELEPVPGRMRPAPGPNGSMLLMDDAKHRPAAALAGILALGELPVKRRIAVLGELWGAAADAYEPVAAALPGRADLVVAVGSSALVYERLLAGTPLEGGVLACPGVAETAETLQRTLRPGDVALVTGSTWQHLQRVQLLLDGAEVACRVRACRLSWRCDVCPALTSGPPPARWIGEPTRK